MPVLELRDGGILEYEDVGSGQPIVFLHGWSLCKEVFEPQRTVLSQQYRVIAPDLRGHGGSSRVARGEGIATLADDLIQLLVDRDLSEVILVGWSMGAMVAWESLQRPETDRVVGIVTIDMVPRLLNDESWKYGLQAGEDAGVFSKPIARMRADWPAFAREFVPKIVARDKAHERAAIIERTLRLVEGNDIDSMIRLWLSMADQDYRQQVTHLRLPSLIAYGQLSQLYSEEASVWLENNLPDSRRVGFADSGHSPHLEQPQTFNAAVQAFITGLTERRGERISGKSTH